MEERLPGQHLEGQQAQHPQVGSLGGSHVVLLHGGWRWLSGIAHRPSSWHTKRQPSLCDNAGAVCQRHRRWPEEFQLACKAANCQVLASVCGTMQETLLRCSPCPTAKQRSALDCCRQDLQADGSHPVQVSSNNFWRCPAHVVLQPHTLTGPGPVPQLDKLPPAAQHRAGRPLTPGCGRGHPPEHKGLQAASRGLQAMLVCTSQHGRRSADCACGPGRAMQRASGVG